MAQSMGMTDPIKDSGENHEHDVDHGEYEPRLPPIDFDRALARAKAEDDVQTIFFINFPLQLEGDAKKALQELMDLVQSWQAWSTTQVEGKVQQQIDAGKLQQDSLARGSYRANVFEYLMRQLTWLAKTFAQNMSKHIAVNKAEFHTEILAAVLEGYAVPASVFNSLEKVMKKISDGIKLSSSRTANTQQYWIMLTKYNEQPITGTTQAGRVITSKPNVRTVTRVIQFQVSQEAREYAVNKSSVESVKFDLNFNPKIFARIPQEIDQKQIATGIELIQKGTIDVAISP
ncbi:hypothetical protein PG994_004836 [Apiospora phragmitis]|uniref:Uncharacterized protein n=1 Tax=Apiospora phragmitis TaxID=2905665 RepID=A0ABR1VRU4_9PEZI